MDQKMQQAIVATRAGHKNEAQLLLTQRLKEDPGDVHAWYLLGLLVESPRKQRAYLGKVLALDPDHEKARQSLTRLEMATVAYDLETETTEEARQAVTEEAELAPAPTLLSAESDFMSQEKGDTLPDWLADDAGHLNLEQIELAETAKSTTIDALEDADIPGWLQDRVDDSWIETEETIQVEAAEESVEQEVVEETEQQALIPAQPELPPATAGKRKAKPVKAQKAPGTKPQPRGGGREQDVWLTRLLMGLIAVAVVVFIVLVYVVVTMF